MKQPPPNPPTSRRRRRPAATQVLAGLARAQLQTLVTCQPLLEQDQDDEALHDFRVALRRLRTLLRLFDRHPDPSLAVRCDRALRWLTRRSGQRRDLDVALRDLALLTSRGELSEAAAALQREPLRRERDRAQRRLLVVLRGARCRQAIEATDRLLMQHEAALTALPLDIEEAARRARRDGTIPRLHEARKAGKQLRYLLEALPALGPGRVRRREIQRAITQLKVLQEELGAICDLGVQAALCENLGVTKKLVSGELTTQLAQLGARLRARADGSARTAAAGLTRTKVALLAQPQTLFLRRANGAKQ